MIDDLIMKKYPKGVDKIECKHVDESMRNKFSDYFPLGNGLVYSCLLVGELCIVH
jgi:hypothetical protein